MCGIFAVCHAASLKCERYNLAKAQEHSGRQMHRGPDYRGAYQNPATGDILCHERLAIMDLACVQPLQGSAPSHQVVHNGEIYNYAVLHSGELASMQLRTTCDSEVLIFLYEKYRDGSICSLLDGVFAFALIHDGEFLAARDPIGVKQMYFGIDGEGRHFFSSEMKSIEDICGAVRVSAFPPGHFFQPEKGFVRYYQPAWIDHRLGTRSVDLPALRSAFVSAVTKRLMSDAPLGLLLSGGLDSSLTSAVATREMRRRGLPIHTFSISVDARSPDAVAARRVADFLGTQHHECHFTPEQGIAALDQIIWHLETYDLMSIRSATPLFFLSKEIRDCGIKVVLAGEGSDEIFGGYLYFHNAPSDEDFQMETIDHVLNLSTNDCLRADKACMAHAVEVRVPFLDKAFLDVAMLTEAAAKRPQQHEGRAVEKFLIRKAFDVEDDPYLPKEVLWRQKEQFADGVGYSWVDSLVEHCAAKISDQDLAQAATEFPFNTPHSKEALYMRRCFHRHFPSAEAARTVRKWLPKWQNSQDPSGRTSLLHNHSIHSGKATTTS